MNKLAGHAGELFVAKQRAEWMNAHLQAVVTTTQNAKAQLKRNFKELQKKNVDLQATITQADMNTEQRLMLPTVQAMLAPLIGSGLCALIIVTTTSRPRRH